MFISVDKPRGDGRRCDLCGSSAPSVRCEKCNQQNFCLSCDDMYHRHPKRQSHFRKVNIFFTQHIYCILFIIFYIYVQ